MSEVRRVMSAEPSLGERMANALASSWEDFIDNTQNALVGLYASIPYLVLWAAILLIAGVATLITVRTVRKKKKD